MTDLGISFFDTSVLIAAHDSSRTGHPESLALLLAATPQSSACAAHSLAEFYAVMSRLPGGRSQRPDIAALFIGQILDRLTLIPLTAPEYAETIRAAAELRIAGGTIFDALLLACARKVNAERIYTWNVRHFQLVAPDLKDRIVTPLLS